MRDALALLRAQAPELEVDGEMHGDAALDGAVRASDPAALAAEGRCQPAGVPSIDAANISYNLLKVAAGSDVTLGPMLLGAEARCTSSPRRRRCAAS